MSTTAINMKLTGNLIKPAKSAARDEPVAESAERDDLERLFRAHHKMIFGVAYRITGSPSDAEDVLQTIFLRLAPKRLDLAPNPEGYLHRAAVNAALDLLKSRARRKSVSLDIVDFDENARHRAASPEAELAGAELREFLRRAVAKLEGRAAAAFALRYFEGCDNQRIAEILDTTQMVVAVTLHRARTRLRREIGSYLEKSNEA